MELYPAHVSCAAKSSGARPLLAGGSVSLMSAEQWPLRVRNVITFSSGSRDESTRSLASTRAWMSDMSPSPCSSSSVLNETLFHDGLVFAKMKPSAIPCSCWYTRPTECQYASEPPRWATWPSWYAVMSLIYACVALLGCATVPAGVLPCSESNSTSNSLMTCS